MASTATVATRPAARAPAVMPPAMSICDSTQPPKMSPLGLASAGMARVRVASVPRGRPGDSAVMDSAIMDSDRGHGQVVSAQLDIGASSGIAYRIGESPVPSRLSPVGWPEAGARRGAGPYHAATDRTNVVSGKE